MEEIKICAGCQYAEATKCCRKCNECYCDECIKLHYIEKHMKKHLKKYLRKMKMLSSMS